MVLRPFFPFYGSKWRAAKLYGPPRHGIVVEPFAGGAGYATYYNSAAVELYDADPYIVGTWDYLIHASAREIRRLPDIDPGVDVRSLGLPQEAQWLIGFCLNPGSAQPKRRRSAAAWAESAGGRWSPERRDLIASQVDSIRHWRIMQSDYRFVPPFRATWFVDPPYVDKGRYYRMRDVQYDHLAVWCAQRRGQVIVCENAGASWLPFEPLATIKASRGTSDEVVWLKEAA